MKVTLESTEKIVHLNGVPARIWQGTTANGIECHAYITRIAVHEDLDAEEFARELHEHAKPRPELEAIPNRMVI